MHKETVIIQYRQNQTNKDPNSFEYDSFTLSVAHETHTLLNC